MRPPRRASPVMLAVAANVLGGTSYVATRMALDALTPSAVVAVRCLAATLVLVPLAGPGAVMAVLRAGGRDRALLFAMAIVGYALPLVLGNWGMHLSSATSASLLITSEPLFIVLLGVLLLNEPLTAGRGIALACGAVGASLVITGGVPLPGADPGITTVGDLLLLVHGAAWAVYTVAGKPLLERYAPLPLTAAGLLIALPCVVLSSLIEGPPPAIDTRVLASIAWAAGLGLVATAGLTFLWNTALRDLDASRLAGFIFLQPLTGVMLGTTLLGEPLGAAAVLGGLLIVGAVWILAREQTAPRTQPA